MGKQRQTQRARSSQRVSQVLKWEQRLRMVAELPLQAMHVV
jgi:hypothetical protein